MFCDKCGAEVQPGQKFCGMCAKPLAASSETSLQTLPLQRHVQLLGVLWIVYSVIFLLGGVVVLIVANTLFGPFGQMEMRIPFFLHPLLSAIGIYLCIKAIAGIIGGYGLLHRLEWARMVVLVLGFLAMLHIPLGTALGIYTVWALLSPGADVQYKALARAGA